ncbi:MAG: hypothetical protein ACTSX7_12745, partial [Alphaproteobacteria bacterium]
MPPSVQHEGPVNTPRSKFTNKTGNGQVNHVADILWLKDAMQSLGRYDDPIEHHGFIDKDLHEAIMG